ncbi:peroxiredoxin-like family protein [Cerasicoccus arenae]|uniref:thioredoxin-dependent peroxiredoxin n=1 Tax=Cerasicoccus arenae TaxID=424488 RepID=A0A8J3DCP6_9BACT|nr:peroxiredoxin-like family protein [Cerasicoccus arenae]MBK1856973.1 AhpC/TSA family protein [Cerasicoccus arenae]GHB90153.1 peroxiredoxin [Cerasicoccus arenae]
MMKICSPCLAIKLSALVLLGSLYLGSEALGQSCCASETKTTQIPSLQKDLDDRADKFAATAPEGMKQTFANGLDHVAKSGVLDTAKKAGDTAPDFTLPNANGEEVNLSALLKNGPVVLVWYRGGWCPYCNMQLHAMQEILPMLQKAGAQLVAISPESPDKTLSTKEKDELEFFVLSDMGNVVAKKYGIVYKLDDATHEIYENRLKLSEFNKNKSGELPLAVTYIVDQDGVIAWDFINSDYKKRAEPAEILKAVQALSTEQSVPAS